MAKRSCASAVISFGLVSIPVKFYVAASAENVGFCMISPLTKGRINQYYRDGAENEIARNATLKGYEYSKTETVIFTPEEIKALEDKNNGSLEIKEFVDHDQVDLLHVEKSYHLGPDKGGDKSYRLLAMALKKSGKYAVGQWSARGKQHLVILRPYEDGIVLHQMFYSNEVRAFDTGPATVPVSDTEVNMACMLIQALAVPKYDSTKYHDSFKKRVLELVEAKRAGMKPPEPQEPVKADVGSLFDALQASLRAQTEKK